MVNTVSKEEQKIWSVLATINDPEIPVLSIIDLGIVRDIKLSGPSGEGQFNGKAGLEVQLTPTYSGCPAMDMIATQIKIEMTALGYRETTITYSLSPPWTTDWMTGEGKRKLLAYGIAPPDKRFVIPRDGVECPHCHSSHTKLVSEFGSTACKAIYKCTDCKEPFDYFKCH